MPWTLEVHTIDVGQGESSLVVAQNVGGVGYRTMLIDGGKLGYGETIQNYLTASIGANAVNHIVNTHYDVDHVGGLMSLLAADNFYVICDKVAQLAAVHGAAGGNRRQRIAGAAAAACGVFLGGYAIPGGVDWSGQSAIAAAAARLGVPGGAGDNAAANYGITEAETDVVPPLNPRLIPSSSVKKRREVCRAIGIAAANAIAAGTAGAALQATIRTTVLNELQTAIGAKFRFSTGGRFNNTHVIDTGNGGEPNGYANIIAGQIMMSSSWIQAPGINRTRTSTPNLGDEILWNSGPNAVAAPANSPAIFVMATNAYVWNAPPADVPIAQAIDNNNDSIGLMLRFNKFFFYTGGDLITAGEDLIADAVMANGLPNPAGGNFALPARIAVFKCGHHGADTCTSQHMLDTILPRVALISCGEGYDHPFQETIDRLHADGNLRYFYLTNCKTNTNHIPASNGQDQLGVGGNKSRVSGDNNDNNLLGGRQRGNILLTIDQAESTSNSTIMPLSPGDTALRQFHVTYFDNDDVMVGGVAAGVVGVRTEDSRF